MNKCWCFILLPFVSLSCLIINDKNQKNKEINKKNFFSEIALNYIFYEANEMD